MKDKLNHWMRMTRFRVLPVMILPVCLGAAGAYAWEETFQLGLFLITLVGAAAAHLFSNMINDLWDYRNGVDSAAKEADSAISTHSGFLTGGRMTEKAFASITWFIFAIAFVCGAVLSIIGGWSIIGLGLLGALIAYFYVAPPLKFGYRGKGYSELAILVSFGVLPVMGTYYVQTQLYDMRAFWLSLPIGLLTTLILFNHHFLHWQADAASGKRTLVVLWGEKHGLTFSKCLAVAAYVALIGCVLMGVLPWYSLICFLTIGPLIKMYSKLKASNDAMAYAQLMGISLKTTIRFGLMMLITLIISGSLS